MKEPRFTAQQIAFLLRHVGALHEPAAAAHVDSADVDPTTVSRPADAGLQAGHAEPAPALASEIDIDAALTVSAAEHAAAVWPESDPVDAQPVSFDPGGVFAIDGEPPTGARSHTAPNGAPDAALDSALGTDPLPAESDTTSAPSSSPFDIEEMLAEIVPRTMPAAAAHEIEPPAPAAAAPPAAAAGPERAVGASLFDRLSHYAPADPPIGIEAAETTPDLVEDEDAAPESAPAPQYLPQGVAQVAPGVAPVVEPVLEPAAESMTLQEPVAPVPEDAEDRAPVVELHSEPHHTPVPPAEPVSTFATPRGDIAQVPTDETETGGALEDAPLFLRRGAGGDTRAKEATPATAVAAQASRDEEDSPVTAEVTTLRTQSPTQIRERLRRKYPGLSDEEIERLYEIEVENARLKLLVARLIVDKPAATGDAVAAEGVYEEDLSFPQTMSEGVGLVKEVAAQAAQRAETALVQARTSVSAHAGEMRERLRAATPVFAYVLRNPVSSGSAAFRAVGHRIGAYLSWPAMKAMLATVRRRSRGRELLLAGILGGLAAGFAVGLWSSPLDELTEASAPVDMRLLLSSGGAGSGILEKGWSRPQPWGVWMEGGDARIVIGFDGPSRGDVELLLEARAAPVKDADPPTVIVSFNSVELGRWQLPKSDGDIRRHFIVPQKVFNRSTEGHLDFVLTGGEQKQSVFGVKSILVRDARLLSNFLGFVDGCETDGVRGWALADEIPVSVTASVNGAPLTAQFRSVERPDLAAPGLSTGAGFELKPATPLAAGTKVDVRFANGRPLRGSPCEIK